MKTMCLKVILVIILSPTAIFSQPTQLNTYGYFDMEAHVDNKDSKGKRATFHQHHFNILTIYQLDNHFRVVGEIEWEHGAAIEADGDGSGAIVLERGWVEYKYLDAFKLKIGKFLAPFGIYNLKHDASPTFLSTVVPSSIYGKHKNTLGVEQMLHPKFGTGIQVLGTLFSNQWEIDYYMYLSNGRGPDPSHKDNNTNKGVGGRLVVNPPLKNLKLGVSYYTDKNGNANNTKQNSLAFDAALEYLNISLESEFLLPTLEKVDNDSVPNGTFRRGNGFYVQGAYTFYDKLTPFLRYVLYDEDVDISNDIETHIVAGINYSVTHKVYLKGEIHFISFENTSIEPFKMLDVSIAVAF